MNSDRIKQDFINRFGDAYQDFGLPVLMGRIVGLLLFYDTPVSLDTMIGELEVSKGPVSQILKRLREHNLVKRVWIGGDRKDYYQVVDHVFLQAFINQAVLLRRNLELAQDFQQKLRQNPDPELTHFQNRINEMVSFNTEMQRYLKAFIDQWKEDQNAF